MSKRKSGAVIEEPTSAHDDASGADASNKRARGDAGAGEESKEADPNAVPPSPVCMCVHDMGPHLRLRDEGLTVIGEKGYRMIRATHGINEGAIYFEIKFLPSQPLRISGKLTSPAVRVGVSTGEGDIQAPVGYDIESYALGSVRGDKIHNAHVAPFAGEGFAPGDVIGVWLVLPADPALSGAQALAKLKEEKQAREEAERGKKRGKNRKRSGATKAAEEAADSQAAAVAAAAAAAAAASLPAVSDAELVQNRKFHRHSFLRFYKNGVPLGGTPEQRARGVGVNAWSDKDVVRAVYFPAVSLYMGAQVKLNFGPNFWATPEEVTRGVAYAQQQQQQEQQLQQAQAAASSEAASHTNAAASSPAIASPSAAIGAASLAPSPPPAAVSPPFRMPLPRPLLTSGLFPHVDGSGSTLQMNPKQAAANAEAAEILRQKAMLAAYHSAMKSGQVPLPGSTGAAEAATTTTSSARAGKA